MPDETKTRSPKTVVAITEPAAPLTAGQLTVRLPSPPLPPVNPAPKRRSRWILAGLIVLVIAAGALVVFQPWAAKGAAVTVET